MSFLRIKPYDGRGGQRRLLLSWFNDELKMILSQDKIDYSENGSKYDKKDDRCRIEICYVGY